MSTLYEIRATPVAQITYTIGMTFTVTLGGVQVERRTLAYLPRETVEDLGFKWRDEGQGVQPATARLVTRLGLSTILDFLHAGEEVPGNISIGVEGYGEFRGGFSKTCTYQKMHLDGLFCEAAARDDPWSGLTSESLCAVCQMPDKMLVCSELIQVKTRWFRAYLAEGIRKVIEAKCTAGNDPGTSVDCIPGVKECWVRRIELP